MRKHLKAGYRCDSKEAEQAFVQLPRWGLTGYQEPTPPQGRECYVEAVEFRIAGLAYSPRNNIVSLSLKEPVAERHGAAYCGDCGEEPCRCYNSGVK